MTITLVHLFRGLAALLVVALTSGLAAPDQARACTLCSCSASTTNASFGTYDPTAAAPTDTSGTITINCTGIISLLGTIEVAANAGSSGDVMQRTMRQGVRSLNYNLYVDPARSIVFGDGTAGSQKITRPLNGLLLFGQSVFFYGRIPARQWASNGTYTDSIVITVTY
jgi:spore coat protein U-like protein